MIDPQNPRNRKLGGLNSANTAPARKTSLPEVTKGTAAEIIAFAAAVREAFEVLWTGRGSPYERVLTYRDAQSMGLAGQTLAYGTAPGEAGIAITTKGGAVQHLSFEQFALGLFRTAAYRQLMKRLDDPTRYDDLPAKVRDLLLVPIAEEAEKRGADVRRIAEKLQGQIDSLAYVSEEVTAAFSGNVAGVRRLVFAYASATRAQAGEITQVQARLTDFQDTTEAGLEALGDRTAEAEQGLIATADAIGGLQSEYYVKLRAGKTVAGIALSATVDPQGNSESAFIVQADRFAIIGATEQVSDPKQPPQARIPFGVDTLNNVIFLNGTVRINADGPTLQGLGRRLLVTANTTVLKFNADGTPNPPTTGTTISGQKVGGLTGAIAWSVIAGSATLSAASGDSVTLMGASMHTDTVTIRGVVTMDGASHYGDITIYKARDGAKGDTGTNGTNGTNGQKGDRGSVTRYTYGTGWSDIVASMSVPNGIPAIGDTVTISSANFAQTKYWDGFGWVNPGVIIDGNLLVSGSVAASKVAAGNMMGVNVIGSARVQVLGNTPGKGWDASTVEGPLRVRQYCDLIVHNESDSAEVFTVLQNAKQVLYLGSEVIRKNTLYNVEVDGEGGHQVKFV